MSIDFQVLSFRDVAPLVQVGLFDNTTLDITGKGFVDVAEVLINGEASPEVAILSKTRLLARIPDSQSRSAISSVSVLLARSGELPTSVVNFKASVGGGVQASGRTKLLQNFLKLMLTRPGSDIKNPQDGGGLHELVGGTTADTELQARATAAVSLSQSQMIESQSGDSRLEDNERLLAATLLAVSFDPQQALLSLKIRLTAMDGTTADANVSFS